MIVACCMLPLLCRNLQSRNGRQRDRAAQNRYQESIVVACHVAGRGDVCCMPNAAMQHRRTPRRKLLTFETVLSQLSQLSQLWPAPPHAARSVAAPLAPFVATCAPRDHARRSTARTRRRPARLRRPTAHAERRCRALRSFMPQGMQRCKPHIHSRHCARRRTHARAVLSTHYCSGGGVVGTKPRTQLTKHPRTVGLDLRGPALQVLTQVLTSSKRKQALVRDRLRGGEANGCGMVTLARA